MRAQLSLQSMAGKGTCCEDRKAFPGDIASIDSRSPLGHCSFSSSGSLRGRATFIAGDDFFQSQVDTVCICFPGSA